MTVAERAMTAKELAKRAMEKRADFSFADTAKNVGQQLQTQFSSLSPVQRNALIGALLGGVGVGGNAFFTGGSPLRDGLTGALLGGLAGGGGTVAYDTLLRGQGFPSSQLPQTELKGISEKANPGWIWPIARNAAGAGAVGAGGAYGAQTAYDYLRGRTAKIRELAKSTKLPVDFNEEATNVLKALEDAKGTGNLSAFDLARDNLSKGVLDDELRHWWNGTRAHDLPALSGKASWTDRLGFINPKKLETMMDARVQARMGNMGIHTWPGTVARIGGPEFGRISAEMSHLPKGKIVLPAAATAALAANLLPLAFGGEN